MGVLDELDLSLRLSREEEAETSTEFAPWTLVEAESKRCARVKVIETVIAAAEAGMRRHGIEVP